MNETVGFFTPAYTLTLPAMSIKLIARLLDFSSFVELFSYIFYLLVEAPFKKMEQIF